MGLFLAVFAVAARAQDEPTKPAPTRLAIEVVGRGDAQPFPVQTREGGYFQIGPPPKRPDWKQPSETAPLTGIKVRAFQEGEGARIKVSAVFDDSRPADAPGPKYGESEQIIASYFAQLDDTITVRELETVGVEAITLRVVKYKEPPVAAPRPLILPEVVNDLKSIAFVDLKTEERSFFQLTLQNLSAKSIVGLSIRVSPHATHSSEGSRDKPLMLPGATCQTPIQIGSSAGDAPDDLRHTLAIETVLFDDGSYEGDVGSAAEMAARSRGRQIQLARFLVLLEDQLVKPGQEPASIIQTLTNSVAKLRIDVDASVLDELQSQYPALPRHNDRKWLAEKIMQGLTTGRGHVLYLLKDLQVKALSSREPVDLNQSLRALRERVAKLAGNQ